jgi:hypothetical protein
LTGKANGWSRVIWIVGPVIAEISKTLSFMVRELGQTVLPAEDAHPAVAAGADAAFDRNRSIGTAVVQGAIIPLVF